MATDITGYFFVYGLPSLLAGLALLHWPWRRHRRFAVRQFIAAPRERIWDIYHVNLDDQASAALHSRVVSVTPDSRDPAVFEVVSDASGGHGTHHTNIRIQTLLEDRPRHSACRICAVDGKPFPNGRDTAEIIHLAEADNGTHVTLGWHGETANWAETLGRRRHVGRYVKRMKKLAETDGAPQPARRTGGSRTPLLMSALALASFALLFGWSGALSLVVVIVLHEYGHWLAMRVTGQPAPRVMLVPFLGGVAVPNHPYKTKFHDAFCALMGPAFSVVPCMMLIGVIVLLLPAVMPQYEGWSPIDGGGAWQAKILLFCAKLVLILGVMNALQLVPVLPLDGGHVLRAVIQSFSGSLARWILLAVTLAGLAGFVYLKDYVLAAVLGLGALQAWYMNSAPSEARTMGVASVAVVGLGYVLAFAVHAGALSYGYLVLSLARQYTPS